MAARRARNGKWCGGVSDPTAPHDLTLEEAVDRHGVCRRCKLFTARRSKQRRRERERRIAEEAAANPPAPEDLGTPVFPRGGAPVWSEPRESAHEALLDVLSSLFDPWPDYPTAPEDYSDFNDAPVPRHFHSNSPEKQRQRYAIRAKARHRKALAERAGDPKWSEYNRRLAALALLS